MPHIVVGDPSQRKSHIGAGNLIAEHYLGVLVEDAPDELSPGQTAEVTLVLMYWPDETYGDVVPNATFTVREGPDVVGFGQVLSRSAA